MKKLLIVCASLLFTLGAAAVPAKRGIWKTIRLADGTEVKAELRGDEFMNYWESADGRRFTMNSATRLFETADFEALRKSAAAKRAVRKASRPAYAQGGPSNVTLGGDHPPYVGEKKGLVILVEFADMPFRDGHDDPRNRFVTHCSDHITLYAVSAALREGQAGQQECHEEQ